MGFIRVQFDKFICLFLILFFCALLLFVHVHGNTQDNNLAQSFKEWAAVFIGALAAAMRPGSSTTETTTTERGTVTDPDTLGETAVTTMREQKKTEE